MPHNGRQKTRSGSSLRVQILLGCPNSTAESRRILANISTYRRECRPQLLLPAAHVPPLREPYPHGHQSDHLHLNEVERKHHGDLSPSAGDHCRNYRNRVPVDLLPELRDV